MSRVSQARSLGKYFLLVDNMLVVLGFFVVFPLISIRFVDQMGWAALMVGIALGLRQFVQQGRGGVKRAYAAGKNGQGRHGGMSRRRLPEKPEIRKRTGRPGTWRWNWRCASAARSR